MSVLVWILLVVLWVVVIGGGALLVPRLYRSIGAASAERGLPEVREELLRLSSTVESLEARLDVMEGKQRFLEDLLEDRPRRIGGVEGPP